MVGALIGKQKGRNVEIMNSFELVFSVIGGDVIIDRDYYNMKEEQCKLGFFDGRTIFCYYFIKQLSRYLAIWILLGGTQQGTYQTAQTLKSTNKFAI